MSRAEMTEALAASGLQGFYGPIPAFEPVEMSLESGECVVISGPNGAGKSSLLKSLVGLMSTRGHVTLSGRDVSQKSPSQRMGAGMGYLPQDDVVVGGISVKENLRLFQSTLGTKRLPENEAVETVLDTFPELSARLEMPASVLSGGERQMLGLSRFLVATDLSTYLVDEPCAGLAPVVADKIIEFVIRLRAAGAAMLIVEHEDRIIDLADRRLWMQEGVIDASGTST